MPSCRIPLLKVQALPGGRITRRRRQGALAPIDDGWWRDVMHDPRARVPAETRIATDDPHRAHYRLDRMPAEFMATCPCGKNAVLDRDKLIAEVGPDMNVVHLVREWMPCDARNKLASHCRAYVVP